MIVEPYRLTPVAPRVALLLGDGEALSEDGEILDLDEWPKGYRLWASYETVYRLVREGKGEALCWRGEEIRWRHKRFEDGWSRRASDAAVLKLPLDHLPVAERLRGLVLWRDWLQSYGASPTGTTGSAAWSLLRATLDRRLATNVGERPPLRLTVGGRQVAPWGAASFEGRLLHLDLPAAYASTLSGLRYGGVWLRSDERVVGRELERYRGSDAPVFVHAQVSVPDAPFGPLIARPRRAPRSYLESALRSSWYPVGKRVQGVWTDAEIAVAERQGARVKVLGGWVHRSGYHPFAAWWRAVESGRDVGGVAGALAKMTGNALWGRFCLDASLGQRSIRARGRTRLHSRPVPAGGQPFPAHDLAETVSGRVRAQLYLLMVEAGEQLVSAHTDGAWVAGELHSLPSTAWRLKEEASRLDLLDPQVYRYFPRPSGREPAHCVSGVPADVAPEWFERRWQEAGPPGLRAHVNQWKEWDHR